MYECVKTVKSKELGIIRYFVVTSYIDDNIETYGIAIEQSGATEEFAEIVDVDLNKLRLVKFIKVLANCYVTCSTLKYVCEDYVEALCEC